MSMAQRQTTNAHTSSKREVWVAQEAQSQFENLGPPRSLREGGLAIAQSGREFRPGSEEYDKKLKQFAESLSEKEFQSIIAARKGKL
jgi:hypothetical protein